MKQQYKEKAIYKIENQINHKIYIGQSIKPEERFKRHKEKRNKEISLINRAINKYGVENFTFEIIGWYTNYNEKEKELIAFYNCQIPNGYNIQSGGEEPPIKYGEDNPFAKISNETAKRIKEDLQDWTISRRQIIKKYKITNDIIRHINDGSSWHEDECIYPIRPKEKEINEWRASQVIDMLKNTTLTHKEIGRRVGWNRSAVTMVNMGKNHHRDNLDYPIRK